MAQKQKDPILDAIAKDGLFGTDIRNVDLSKPFKEEKPAPEPVRTIQPSSIYLANDLGKKIKLIRGTNGSKLAHAGYLEAAKLVAAQGLRLPSNVLHDDYLVGSDKWKKLDKKGYYGAWVREIIAYPEIDGTFVVGRDIVDSETTWIVPANYIPAEAIGVKGVGLFIDPAEVKKENGKMVVIPKTVIVLNGIIQESGAGGKVDRETRVPLQVDAQLLEQLPDDETRWIFRIDGVGVRPLARGYGNLCEPRGIVSSYLPASAFGVSGVEYA